MRSELLVRSSLCLTMLATALNGEEPGAVFHSAAGVQLGQSSDIADFHPRAACAHTAAAASTRRVDGGA